MEALIQALESELAMRTEAYRNAIGATRSLLEDYNGRYPSTHLGHNLASRASELSEIAAKIEQTKSVLAFLKEKKG